MRRPMPVGTWGKISRTQVRPGHWYADARYRGHDGSTRRVRRYTPSGVSDRTGAAAERALIEALTEASSVAGEDVTSETLVADLWVKYREELVALDRAPRTLERYDEVAAFIRRGVGQLRLREASPQRLDTFITAVAVNHGNANAKTTRSVLSGMWRYAIRVGAASTNPVTNTRAVTEKPAKKARALTTVQLAGVLRDVRSSEEPCPPVERGEVQETSYRIPTVAEYCAAADLADLITMFTATGVRISELLAIEWSGVDLAERTVKVDGKIVRHRGVGLVRVARDDDPKNRTRILAIPDYAVTVLRARKLATPPNDAGVVFASTRGTYREPTTVNRQWRRVRHALDLDWVTGHSFRRTVASILDEERLSARVTADQLGHASPSMTQNRYMVRGTVRHEVAAILDAAVKVESFRRVNRDTEVDDAL